MLSCTARAKASGSKPSTPGEPAGIGPDLIVQLAHHSWDAILVIFADKDMLLERAAMLDLALDVIPYQQQTTKAPLGSLYVQHIPCAEPVVAGQLKSSFQLSRCRIPFQAVSCSCQSMASNT